MLFFWKYKEVFCGNSLEKFNAVRNALADKGVKYHYKLKRRDDSPPFRSPARDMLGRAGENTSASTMYYIYVAKDDYEAARYAVNAK